MNEYVAPGLFDRLSSLWHELVSSRAPDLVENIQPALPADDLTRVRDQMNACLEGKGGEVSARARAAALGKAYLRLDPEGRRRFLTVMATEFDVDRAAVDAAVQAMAKAPAEKRPAAEEALRTALEAPRLRLLTQFNALPNGVKFLVDMRAELMALSRQHPELKALETDLRNLLTRWFDVGFLELRRITWDSPASILEKLMAYEAVHAIRSWDDLKNRLDSDRRLFAFFHPRMPDEPLIFVQVALLPEMAANIQDLLDVSAPLGDPSKATTAIFYSISNAQQGLSGISFGNFLIKKVVEVLLAEFPGLKTFATLSPVPGFLSWLAEQEEAEQAGGTPLLTPAEAKSLKTVLDVAPLSATIGGVRWWHEAGQADALQPVILRLTARYLAQEKRPGRKGAAPTALDPVAHFHLTNGARIDRLNWLGDTSAKGMAQSAGMMVNYLYRLGEIEKNHETYAERGTAVLSPAVKALLKG